MKDLVILLSLMFLPFLITLILMLVVSSDALTSVIKFKTKEDEKE